MDNNSAVAAAVGNGQEATRGQKILALAMCNKYKKDQADFEYLAEILDLGEIWEEALNGVTRPVADKRPINRVVRNNPNNRVGRP